MSSEPNWTYFDKRALLPRVRRRRQIGRAPVSPLAWNDIFESRIPQEWRYTFISSVVDTLAWLMDGEAVSNVWRLWELSNEGFYLAPIAKEKLHLRRTDRFFDELVQADTAGLIATLLSANWQLSALSAPSSMHQVMKLERALKGFAEMHPDVREILNVID